MIGYKILLEKYVRHVSEVEGVDFVGKINGGCGAEVPFSAAEVVEMKRISARVSVQDFCPIKEWGGKN